MISKRLCECCVVFTVLVVWVPILLAYSAGDTIRFSYRFPLPLKADIRDLGKIAADREISEISKAGEGYFRFEMIPSLVEVSDGMECVAVRVMFHGGTDSKCILYAVSDPRPEFAGKLIPEFDIRTMHLKSGDSVVVDLNGARLILSLDSVAYTQLVDPSGYVGVFRSLDYSVRLDRIDIAVDTLYVTSVSSKGLNGGLACADCPSTDKQYVGLVLRNRGTVLIPHVSVRFKAGEASQFDRGVYNLKPDSLAVIEFFSRLIPVEKNWRIAITIDPTDRIKEVNETNNSTQANASIWYAHREIDGQEQPFELCRDSYGQFPNFGWGDDRDRNEAFAEFVSSVLGNSLPGSAVQSPVNPFDLLYKAYAGSQGHCYGMASTECIYFEYPEFKPYAVDVFDLEKYYAVMRNIGKYHQLQTAHQVEAWYLAQPVSRRSMSLEAGNVTERLESIGMPSMLMLGLPGGQRHAVTGYKVVDLGRKIIVSIHDSNDVLSQRLVSSVVIFDLEDETACLGEEYPDYGYYLYNPDDYRISGFPYRFNGVVESVLVRPPHLSADDCRTHLVQIMTSVLEGRPAR
jgi:hypothetical protein